MTRYEVAELERAEAALWQFLNVLKFGDETTLAALVYPPSFETWGVAPGHIGREFLDMAGISAEVLERLGIVHTARVLPGRSGPRGLVAFGMIEGEGHAALVLVPTPAHALALIFDDGEWRVWGMPDPREFADAELVGPHAEGPARGEMLSVLASEWVMALVPHLDARMRLRGAPNDEAILVAPVEGAHAIAAMACWHSPSNRWVRVSSPLDGSRARCPTQSWTVYPMTTGSRSLSSCSWFGTWSPTTTSGGSR